MALQFSTTARNAMLDSIETTAGTSAIIKIRSGSAPAGCGSADTGVSLAEFDLASDWAAAASSGTKTLNNLTLSTTGAAAGSAGHFRLYASNGTTCHMQGTAGTSGTDMILDNTSIASGQTVQIVSFTLTAPGV